MISKPNTHSFGIDRIMSFIPRHYSWDYRYEHERGK